MVKSILIVYSTRFGATEGVAQFIADEYRNKNLDVRLVNLKKVKKKEIPNPKDYNMTIIGVSIQIGQWQSVAKKFMKASATFFRNNPDKWAFFAVCGDAAQNEKKQIACEKYIEKPLKMMEINPKNFIAVGGVLDLTNSSKIPPLRKKMMKMAAQNDVESGHIDPLGKNDFRDWNEIKEFAEKII